MEVSELLLYVHIYIYNKTRETCSYWLFYTFRCICVFTKKLRVPEYPKISNSGYPVPEITENEQRYMYIGKLPFCWVSHLIRGVI